MMREDSYGVPAPERVTQALNLLQARMPSALYGCLFDAAHRVSQPARNTPIPLPGTSSRPPTAILEVTVFHGQQASYAEARPGGWSRVAHSWQRWQAPDNHFTIFNAANVPSLGRQLLDCIGKSTVAGARGIEEIGRC